MKIGIDCRMYSSDFTGIGRYVYELVENLFKIDQQNEYVLFFNEPEFSKYQTQSKCVKKVLANASHYSLKEQTHFLKILKNENLDLMHFTHFNAPIFYKKPSVVTIHDLTLHFYPGKKITSPLHRAGYYKVIKSAVKNAKKIITVSQNTKKDLQVLMKTPSQKIHVIYEGVNEKFKPLTDRHPVEEVTKKYQLDKPYLLYTGVWRSHKNLPNLIKAFHILKTEYDFDGYLVITGRKDPVYEADVVGETQTLQLANDVIFTGLVKERELVPLYNGALMYVFPSLYEGFGLPPLEAMQCGIPVAVSNASCLPEVCGQNNAVFFNPNDPKDMAEKIFQVTSQKTLREQLIQNGLKRVKEFSWQKMAQETLQVYNDALQS